MKTPVFTPEIEISTKDELSGATFFLVIESTQFKIAAGGLRITESVSLEEVRRLAQSMSYKFQTYNLPVSGAKSGIKLPPNVTLKERENILRRFAITFSRYLKQIYIIGEDLGAGPKDLEIIFDEINEHPFVVAKEILLNTTMKSLVLKTPNFIIRNFFPNYSDSALDLSCSVMSLIVDEVRLKANLHIPTISIIGIGSIGMGLLNNLNENSYKLIRVADKFNAYECLDGFELADLAGAVDKSGIINIDSYKKPNSITVISHDEIFERTVDFLIPSASMDQINESNVEKIDCKFIFEAANISMSYQFEEFLFNRDIQVIPDFLFNSATSCSFGLLVANRVNAFSHRLQRRETTKLMVGTFIKFWETSLIEKRCIRDVFFSRRDH